MDCSVAGYLTIIPLLLSGIQCFTSKRVPTLLLYIYTGIIVFLIAAIAVADLVLYGYWQLRFDSTPLFYFFSSPGAALASASPILITTGILIILLISFILWFAGYILWKKNFILIKKSSPIITVIMLVIMIAPVIVAIRGGFTVSSMNPSRAYFHTDQRLNNAALNPHFLLFYTLFHPDVYTSQYRFFDSVKCSEMIADMNKRLLPESTTDTVNFDSGVRICTVKDDSKLIGSSLAPDIYLVILESFSSHLLPSLGGDSIAVNLESIAVDNILFTDIYANAHRTDRALPSILSGLPAQPSASIMKYINKVNKLPSVPAKLKEAGYDIQYFYGGDLNFTNMLAYLRGMGFESITGDKDFTVRERSSKWGAHDDVLLSKVKESVQASPESAPTLRVIQTSSSHEPFEVPYLNSKYKDNPRLNAFSFTDSVIGKFYRDIMSIPSSRPRIFIFVPDHYGVWPQNLQHAPDRHRIPLIIAGDITRIPILSNAPKQISTIGASADIASTLLFMLCIKSDEFIFSKNLFDNYSPHYALFAEPGLWGMVMPDGYVVINPDSDSILEGNGEFADYAKATLQQLYQYLDRL